MNRHPEMRDLNESDLREYAEENFGVIPVQFDACKRTVSLMDLNGDEKVSPHEFLQVWKVALDDRRVTDNEINNIFRQIAGHNNYEFGLTDLLTQIRIEGNISQRVVKTIIDNQKKITEFRESIMKTDQRQDRESQTKEVNLLKEQVKDLAKKNRKLEEEGLEFGKCLEEAINNNEITQNKLNEQSEECRKFEVENAELQNTINLLNRNNNNTQDLRTDPSSDQIIKELEQDISKLSQDNSILKKKFERGEREKEDLEQQITTLSIIVKDNETHIEEIRSEVAILKQKRDELIEESHIHQKFIEELNQECSAKIDDQIYKEVLKEKEAMITKYKVLEGEVKVYEEKQEEERRINEKLQKSIEDLDLERVKLSNENNEVLETIKRNNKKHREEVEHLKHDFEVEEARICSEKDEIFQTIKENSKKHKDEIEQLKDELENVYVDLQELKNKNFRADECNTNLNITIEELRRNIANLQEEKLVIEKVLINRDGEVQKLATEKKELEAKETLYSQKFEEEQRELNNKKQLEEELHRLRREYSDMVSNKDKDNNTLNQMVQDLKGEIDQLQSLLKASRNEFELASAEVEILRGKNENNNELTLQVENLAIKNEKLCQELKNSNQQITKLELIQEENERLKKVVEDFEKNSKNTVKETLNNHEQVQPSLQIEIQKEEDDQRPIEKFEDDTQGQLEAVSLEDSEFKDIISQPVENEKGLEDDINTIQSKHSELENNFLSLMVEFVILKVSEEIYFEDVNKAMNTEEVDLKGENSTQSKSEESVQELEELKSTVQMLVTEKQELSCQNQILENKIKSLQLKIEGKNDNLRSTLTEMISKFSQLIETKDQEIMQSGPSLQEDLLLNGDLDKNASKEKETFVVEQDQKLNGCEVMTSHVLSRE